MSEEATDSDSKRYRQCSAIHDLMPGDAETPLRVGGEYQLNRRSGSATLRMAVPQGINPAILLLNLVIEPGNGGDWVPIGFELKHVDRGRYTSVTIVDADGHGTSMPVEEVH